MKWNTSRKLIAACCSALCVLSMHRLIAQTFEPGVEPAEDRAESDVDHEPTEAVVYCANLEYGDGKTAVCYSAQFLSTVAQETNIQTHPGFDTVRLDSAELFDYPYAVMSGEGSFTLPQEQVRYLQDYLYGGGFLVASAGCSSKPWNDSFKTMMAQAFPDLAMVKLDADHPIFHSVYDITQSNYKTGGPKLPHLEALTIDGRVVLVWSPDGLNDTGNAGPNCCCCGGNEVKSALKLNVNLLAYALTH